MHLAERAYRLIALTAILAIAAIWASDPALQGLWRWPALLLLAGLAFEAWEQQRFALSASLDAPESLYLGREQTCSFRFEHDAHRDLTLQYAPAAPPGFAPLGAPRLLRAPRGAPTADPCVLKALRLGSHAWVALPARVLGRWRLAWWGCELGVATRIRVAPDTMRVARSVARGTSAGLRPRAVHGGGSELWQLRSYVAGDPLARIDWKASARLRQFTTREYSDDQQLDILFAIDAGRLSRGGVGDLDRLGLFANVVARLAEHAVARDDRVGLLVYSDRVLCVCAPDRGVRAVTRLRAELAGLAAHATESEPLAAALRIRSLLKQRSLVVLFCDLDDATLSGELRRAVACLNPPHLTLLAGVRSSEIEGLYMRAARSRQDPWIALAAREHEERAAAHVAALRRAGAPVVHAPAQDLERAVFSEYDALRRRRRI